MSEAHSDRRGSSGARKALAAVSDALADWREDVAASTENHTEAITEKMGEAAKAMGWPDEVVEGSKRHLTQMSKLQLEMLDRLIDAWQDQLKSPMPGQLMSALSMPGPGFEGPFAMAGLASKPMELWMQAALAWQRNLWSLWSGQGMGFGGGQGRARPH